jgi:hypothetical protein
MGQKNSLSVFGDKIGLAFWGLTNSIRLQFVVLFTVWQLVSKTIIPIARPYQDFARFIFLKVFIQLIKKG